MDSGITTDRTNLPVWMRCTASMSPTLSGNVLHRKSEWMHFRSLPQESNYHGKVQFISADSSLDFDQGHLKMKVKQA